MPLYRDNAEILCDAPGCPSFAPETYRPKGVHTYPLACLYRSRGFALHIVGQCFHIARVDGTELEFPFGFFRSVLRLDQLVRWVTTSGEELSQREESIGAAARFADTLSNIAHVSRIVNVNVDELGAVPGRYHARLIRVVSDWTKGFEHSSIAGAWLTPANDERRRGESRETTRVEVEGLWLCEEQKVYGHLGGYPAELVAYSVKPLAT
jgi:hypothetical protein